jgi:hypothetical protein
MENELDTTPSTETTPEQELEERRKNAGLEIQAVLEKYNVQLIQQIVIVPKE